jgi:hypothetical protein
MRTFHRRRTAETFDTSLVEATPAALLVLDQSGSIIRRNPAADALAEMVTRDGGEHAFAALRDGLQETVRGARSLPLVKLLVVERAGERAAAEFSIARLGDGFTATWTDATAREESRRSLSGLAAELAEASRSLTELGDQLAHDTDQVAVETDTVATGATQFSGSISDIARTAASAATNSTKAVESARAVSEQVRRLDASSEKIGSVTNIISSVAAQTNLLALNATIEAARAGEAGKGFAVVANEVKDLSHRTATATAEISGTIAEIQRAGGAAAEAVDSILVLVGQIAQDQTTIAAAVEEQLVVSNDISSGISAAAGSSLSLSLVIGELQSTAARVAEKVREVEEALGPPPNNGA